MVIMLLPSSIGLVLEGDFDKFRQDVADNVAEAIFDVVFPAIRDQACGEIFNPACSVVDRTGWAVKTVTTASWVTSVICLLSVVVERYREEIETVIDYAKQFLVGWFVMLPTIGIEYLISIPARVRGDYSDEY